MIDGASLSDSDEAASHHVDDLNLQERSSRSTVRCETGLGKPAIWLW